MQSQTENISSIAGDSKQPLPPSWMEHLEEEFRAPYMLELKAFLKSQTSAKKIIYPHAKDWFNAFWATDFESVKVVLIGQDPYHGPGQAHGLSFSVPPGVKVPPSLQNIYKELKSDLGVAIPSNGHLMGWAKQGVLLLNATLSVEKERAGSHQNKGWEIFTDSVVRVLNEKRQHLVFFLWGSYAQKKGSVVDPSRHLVIHSPHPSPLSSHRGFFGSRPFSQANAYLDQHKLQTIDWAAL